VRDRGCSSVFFITPFNVSGSSQQLMWRSNAEENLW
jgi:hypothetical protein